MCVSEIAHQLDRTCRALVEGKATFLAVFQVHFITPILAEFLDDVAGTLTEAVIALEAVSAGHAAASLIGVVVSSRLSDT